MTARTTSETGDTAQTTGTEEMGRPQRPREIAGRYIVFGLLALGVVATIMLFIYWNEHTRPFRPLRHAIGREIRHSRPNVEGGRQKGKGPWVLRISLTVDFPPGEDSLRANEVCQRVLKITRQNHDLQGVDVIEVNLIQFVPQELAKTRKFVWNVHELTDDSPPETTGAAP